MKLISRIKKEAYPTWEVVKVRQFLFNPEREIEVKVKKPLGKDSRIKVKGNAINSDWMKIEMKFFFIREKKYRMPPNITKNFCALLERSKAKVRVPSLEEQNKEAIRKERRKIYRRVKKHG